MLISPRRTLTLLLLPLLLLGWLPAARASAGMLRPYRLTTALQVDPLSVDPAALRFGWLLGTADPSTRSLTQAGYRILVASSAALLAHNRADLWDSGRIAAVAYWQQPYLGPALQPLTTYYWKVQAWTACPAMGAPCSAAPGAWSTPARFTTALNKADWTAQWIAAPATGPAGALPVFRRELHLRGPVASALLTVTGLGQYELHLNGAPVTDAVLTPGWTNYRKSVFYNTYDVRPLLRPGANTLGILLGNGMYNVEDTPGRYTKFAASFGQPRCLLQLQVRYADGTAERFASDGSWQTHPGPITYSSIYGGEDHNAAALPTGWDRPGFDARGWPQAQVVEGPGGVLTPEAAAPITIAQQLQPVRVTHPTPGTTVYDLGQTMSGWPALAVRGQAGAGVRLLCGELLAADGTVTQRSIHAFPDNPVLFHYTLGGAAAGERWHPRFSYTSFRYVQVSTTPAAPGGPAPQVLALAGDFVHAQAAVVGQFASASTLFNRIHTLIDRAVLSNLASVLTDCPSREKLGWLEQTYLNAATVLLNYDAARLYQKVSGDIADAQLPSGLVPSIAPEYVAFREESGPHAGQDTAFRDSPEWGSAVILSPWALYSLTGDAAPLAAHYADMQRYAAYLAGRAHGGLLDYGLGDWYDLGPAAPGPAQLTSRTVTATGTFYADLRALAGIATLLGKPDDATRYASEADAVRDAFNATLFHPQTDQYDRGSQTANALPLALGMVPPGHAAAVLAHLVADIHAHSDHVTAGDVGFHYVVRALTDNGRSDVLAAMLARTDAPSYGHQLAQGATTLAEAWDANPDSSQNHFMLGHGEEWFYRGLAGLSIDMAREPGDEILFAPNFVPHVAWAAAGYQSPFGRVAIRWHRSRQAATVTLTIPPGAVATLHLPRAGSWHQAGGALTGTAGSNRLGSGTYRFSTATLRPNGPMPGHPGSF